MTRAHDDACKESQLGSFSMKSFNNKKKRQMKNLTITILE